MSPVLLLPVGSDAKPNSSACSKGSESSPVWHHKGCWHLSHAHSNPPPPSFPNATLPTDHWKWLIVYLERIEKGILECFIDMYLKKNNYLHWIKLFYCNMTPLWLFLLFLFFFFFAVVATNLTWLCAVIGGTQHESFERLLWIHRRLLFLWPNRKSEARGRDPSRWTAKQDIDQKANQIKRLTT